MLDSNNRFKVNTAIASSLKVPAKFAQCPATDGLLGQDTSLQIFKYQQPNLCFCFAAAAESIVHRVALDA